LATAPDYWHVYPVAYSPLSANPYSTGRLAVVPVAGGKSDLGMFYAASDLPGALWEVLLRHVAPDDQRHVHIDVAKLAGMRAVRLRLRHAAPVLELGQPGLRVLFPINSPGASRSRRCWQNRTRGPPTLTRALREDLVRVGMTDMPVLSWPSRQHHPSTVYLAYAPPMQDTWWEVIEDPLPLDTLAGYELVRNELARCGFIWEPLETDSTPPPPPGAE
jgi:hypothetical protein